MLGVRPPTLCVEAAVRTHDRPAAGARHHVRDMLRISRGEDFCPSSYPPAFTVWPR